MHDDIDHTQPQAGQASSQPSIARRREILKRIGQGSLAAGAAASPLAAMATGTRKWCRHPVNTNVCVQASISGMASVVLSAQASDEVMSKRCSHYASTGNWPASCSNGSVGITHGSSFATAFNCAAGASDSLGVPRGQNGCLLNKSLRDLCYSYSSSQEAHWACALANANKLAVPASGAAFPYTPGQVVGQYQNTGVRPSAYAFYTTYCENYS